MLATEMLLEIEANFGELVESIVPVELDGEMLRLVLYLKNGTNLRVTEQWNGSVLERYSYYWLTSKNEQRSAGTRTASYTLRYLSITSMWALKQICVLIGEPA
jgi:hypothetical protein